MKLSSLGLGLAVMVMGCAAQQGAPTTSASPPTATAPVAHASPATTTDATVLDEAVRLYQQEDYEEAARAFEEAYALDQEPSLLLAQAQALRLAGECEQAKPLYEAFLREAPAPTYAGWVQQVSDECTAR